MKVLKFGGTSVGTPQSLRNVKHIVESITDDKAIVVVSALGGITDKLISTAKTASSGNLEYIVTYAEIVRRHLEMITELVDPASRPDVLKAVNPLLEELGNIFRGISLVRDLSQRTLDVIVSYGERMSSVIVSNVITGAKLFDSRNFIITHNVHGRHVLNQETTDEKIHSTFDNARFNVAVVPGFISSDESGDITNLGRGGSDYTAAILASSLEADILEIWTDVDGFMTADPRIIKDARVLEIMSFSEAMDLCNYGAKVIYPPTIYPVFRRNIPIIVKNTFNPSAPGTLIVNDTTRVDEMEIKGISSISDVTVVALTGSGVEEIKNFTSRIFEACANKGIDPLLVSLAFSDARVLVAVKTADASKTVGILTERFMPELQSGALSEISSSTGFSSIAIVGDRMRHTPGIMGRLSLALENESIEVVASSQGATENKAVFIVKDNILEKAMNALHSKCFN